MKERKVLGRGIASLIPPPSFAKAEISTETAEATPTERVAEIDIDAIRANPRQPRRIFSESALEELTQSIERVGVLQPLLVRKTELGYELIAGERRLRAAKRAGLRRVPVIVRGGTDRDQLEIALIENLQREDLNPIEEARGYERLAQEFSLTQDEIAQQVGKERTTVTNMLRLLKLSTVVQEKLASGALTMGHARALLSLEDDRRQEALMQRIEKEGLSVRQVESLVRSMVTKTTPRSRRATDQTDVNVRHLEEDFQRALGTRVEIVARGKGGEVRVHYYSADDLKRLTDHFLG